MNALKNLSLILLLFLWHLQAATTRVPNSTISTSRSTLPNMPPASTSKGADGKESVLITVTNPWQGADSVTTWLFIARNGEEIPEGFAGQALEGDAKRIVAMSSTHIAMLDAIGEVGRVAGVSGIDYISNPDIQARRDSIGDVGYEGNINYELLLSLDPDLVLLYGVNGAKRNGKQARRTRHTVHVCRRLPRRIATRQSRMDGGTFGSSRKTRGWRKPLQQFLSDTTL